MHEDKLQVQRFFSVVLTLKGRTFSLYGLFVDNMPCILKETLPVIFLILWLSRRFTLFQLIHVLRKFSVL